MMKSQSKGSNAVNLIIVLGISFLWATVSGMVWFLGFGELVNRFGVGNDDDTLRIILYAIIIFIVVFLVSFAKNKDEEYL